MAESENESEGGRKKGVVESESKGGTMAVNVLKSEIRVWNLEKV